MCSDFAKSVVPVPVEHELKQSYINYAMSVIVMRALPDVRDGLNLCIGVCFMPCMNCVTTGTSRTKISAG